MINVVNRLIKCLFLWLSMWVSIKTGVYNDPNKTSKKGRILRLRLVWMVIYVNVTYMLVLNINSLLLPLVDLK